MVAANFEDGTENLRSNLHVVLQRNWFSVTNINSKYSLLNITR